MLKRVLVILLSIVSFLSFYGCASSDNSGSLKVQTDVSEDALGDLEVEDEETEDGVDSSGGGSAEYGEGADSGEEEDLYDDSYIFDDSEFLQSNPYDNDTGTTSGKSAGNTVTTTTSTANSNDSKLTFTLILNIDGKKHEYTQSFSASENSIKYVCIDLFEANNISYSVSSNGREFDMIAGKQAGKEGAWIAKYNGKYFDGEINSGKVSDGDKMEFTFVEF